MLYLMDASIGFAKVVWFHRLEGMCGLVKLWLVGNDVKIFWKLWGDHVDGCIGQIRDRCSVVGIWWVFGGLGFG